MAYDIGPKIGIEGEAEFRKAIREINANMRTLGTEMKAVTSAFGKNDKSLEALSAKNKVLNKQIDEQTQKLLGLREGLAQARDRYGETDKVTQGWQRSVNQATADLNDMGRELEENQKAIEGYSEAQIQAAKDSEEFRVAQDKLKGTFGAVKKAAVITSAAIVSALGASAKAAIDYEDAFAGVRKTVEATEEQFKELSDGIRNLTREMPQSAVEISGVAEAAGQLGIETNNILGFSKTMVMLGDATNLSSDQAATALARFANITQMSQKDFDRLGSVIVDLGNNLATSEAEIVSMGMRLAGAGKQVGMTEAQIMALAGSLSSVGIEAEAGGSAMSKVMVNMQLAVEKGGKSLDDFAKVANMSASEFSKAYKEDAAGALVAFITGLQDTKRLGSSAIKVLDDMGISEVRMRDALLRAAGAGDLFTDSLELGTKAWDENLALQKEAEQRYKTVASQIKIFKNTIVDTGIEIGEGMLPEIQGMIDKLKKVDTKPVIDGFKWIINNGSTIASVAGAIGAGMVAWNVATTVQSVVVAMKSWKTITEGMTIAQAALNAVTSASPVGAMTIAVAGAVAAFGALKIITSDNTSEAKKLTESIDKNIEAWEDLKLQQEENIRTSVAEIDHTKELWRELQTLVNANGEVLGSKERVKYISEEINKLAPDTISWIDEETIAYNQTAEAIDNLIAKKRAQIILEAQEEKYRKAITELGDKEQEQMALAIELSKQAERVQESKAESLKNYGIVGGVEYAREEARLRDLQDRYSENESILGEYYSTIQSYEENSIAISEGNYEKIKEINRGTVTSYKTATDGTVEELKKQAEEAALNAVLMRERYRMGVEGVTEDMVKTAEEAAVTASKEYEKIGGNIVSGIETGVKDKENGLFYTVSQMANKAARAAKDALGIKSPSRVFAEIGKDIGRGLVSGIEKSRNIVVKSAKSIGELLIKEEEKIQKQLKEMDLAAIERRESESEKKHKEALDKKYAELAKASKSGKQKVLDEIAKLQADREKELAESSERNLKDSLNNQLKVVQNFKTEYERAVDDIQKSQDNMSQKLIAFGGLFERTQTQLGEKFKLANLEKEISTITRYGEALEELKGRGISDSLMEEITKMSIEDALDYTGRLLSKTDEQYAEYMNLWEEKQRLSKEIATRFYKDELDSLKAEFVDKIPSQLSGVKDEMRDIGANAGKGLANGFRSQKEYIKRTFVGVLEESLKAAKESMEIRSPSQKWAEIGKFMASGLGQGFVSEMQGVTRQINNSIPTSVTMTGHNQIAKMGEGIVNGLAGIMPTNNQPAIIKIMLASGKELAEVVWDPLTGIAKQKGVAFSG